MDLKELGAMNPEKEAAEKIGSNIRTMQRWRSLGTGPRYVRVGKRIYYPDAYLLEYIAQNSSAA